MESLIENVTEFCDHISQHFIERFIMLFYFRQFMLYFFVFNCCLKSSNRCIKDLSRCGGSDNEFTVYSVPQLFLIELTTDDSDQNFSNTARSVVTCSPSNSSESQRWLSESFVASTTEYVYL